MSYSPLPRGEGWLRPLLLKRNQFHSAPVSEDGYGAVPLYGGQYNGQYTCQYNGQYSGQYKSKYNGQNNSKYNGRTVKLCLYGRTVATQEIGQHRPVQWSVQWPTQCTTQKAIPLETLVKHST